MKAHAIEKVTEIMAAVASFGAVHAATTFNGGDLGTAGKQTNGLPTSSGNPGIMAVNGTVVDNPFTTFIDHYITQTAGVISFSTTHSPDPGAAK